MDPGYIIISAGITIASLILFGIALHSYMVTSNKKLLFVLFVFLFFLIRGSLLSASLIFEPLAWFATSYYTWVIDIVILTLLYLAALKR